MLLIVGLVTVFTDKGKLGVKIISVLAFIVSAISVGTAILLLSYFPGIGVAIAITLGLNAVLTFYLLSVKAVPPDSQNE